ncbi:MAG TPA: cellulase-like family protein [Ktedonobacteraceae bacterium]|nr:cellulase-like family protein [Ktedonobacteraceae bacterium]
MRLTRLSHPLAITMWDFSWLERRWPGAGYEDWDQALDELQKRGYDAIRIDAYPHLVALDPQREWELLPTWNQQDWGSPALTRVQVLPALTQFLEKCRERGLLVGLSSWFRRDRADSCMLLTTPEKLAMAWQKTLQSIEAANLLDTILYVDLCNEFPLHIWAPYFAPDASDEDEVLRDTPEGRRWMSEAITLLRTAYPDLDYCFSFTTEFSVQQNVAIHDLLELHIWMVQWCDFYEQVGYHFERFEAIGYENMVQRAEPLYRSRPDHWQQALRQGIELAAEWSRTAGKPLITTECWGVVDYKDWPLLNWDWIKELCEIGVQNASATGRWAALATSNFCGPQFVGMWRDIAWHRRLTDLIHRGPLTCFS